MSANRERKYIEVIPSAKRLSESLRNMGYDFVRAVADIVDNSIQANSTEIIIEARFDGEYSWIRISDNGKGMSSEEITEAMRIGTMRDYDVGELGKFGLGLKMASLSQCTRFTVASRCKGCDIEIRRFDLDEVKNSNKWEIADIPESQCSRDLINPISDHQGTVVFWEHLDRLIEYKIPSGGAARNWFNKKIRALEDHLGMVFHRFISGEAGEGNKITIKVGKNTINPWDPFARKETATMRMEPLILTLQGGSGTYMVKCSPFILPSLRTFSSRSAFDYFGKNEWNERQGFYIYRQNRLIQDGGWNEMRTPDEHTKFARIALDFSPEADAEMGVDIKKASIILPDNLKEAIKSTVSNAVNLARKNYSPDNATSHRTVVGTKTKEGAEYEPISSSITITGGPPEIEIQASVVNPQDQRSQSFQKKDSEDELIEILRASNSSTEERLSVLHELFPKVIVKIAQNVGEEIAIEKIKKEMNYLYPDLAKLLGW